MPVRQTAVVAGGGIAGLAAAVALAQAGWRVTVLERASAFGEVGAGLGFTGNGMAALHALGVEEAVRAAGHLAPHAGYQDPSGRWLLRIPEARSDPRAITTVCGIHRQRLHATLRQAAEAAGAELVTGAEVTAVRSGDPPGRAERRARQRAGVEVPDLVGPPGELPAVRGALVAVVVDGAVQPLAAVAGAGELSRVGAAGRGVAVQLDRARVSVLHEELPLGSCRRSPPARIFSWPASSTGCWASTARRRGVNNDARRARSRIVAASVNSPRSASVSTRSAMA
jgi:2-polyprenyl-6-methoxyphenol hydroxylase-like FAD-dependent oxidoreductase